MGPLAGPSLLRGALRQVGHSFFTGHPSFGCHCYMPVVVHPGSLVWAHKGCEVHPDHVPVTVSRSLPNTCSHSCLLLYIPSFLIIVSHVVLVGW